MKTKTFALALLAIVFTLSASATKIPKMNIVALDNSKALIAAITDAQESAEVSITDKNGRMVYYKESKAAPEFKSIFNLSELEDGNYTVKIKTGNNAAKGELEVHNGDIEVRTIKTEIDPYFGLDGNLLRVTYLNFEQKNIALHIYKGSQLVFEHKMGNDFDLQRGFNLAQLEKGKYDILLTGADKEFNYSITK